MVNLKRHLENKMVTQQTIIQSLLVKKLVMQFYNLKKQKINWCLIYIDPIKKCQNEDYRSNGSILSSTRNMDTFARLGGATELRNIYYFDITYII